MRVLDPGHVYKLAWLDGYPEVAGVGSRPHTRMSEDVLIFVKREGPGFPENVGHHAGTTMQEVIRALIDRVKYVDNQIHDHRNDLVLRDLRHAIWMLEQRAADRHRRDWGIGDDLDRIEELPTCPKCLHIGCEGACHP